MQRLLKNRLGTTAMEFGLIAIPICFMVFGVFDLGRYALVQHSLSTLADESARQEIICYSPYLAANNLAGASCSGDPVSNKLVLAPFLAGLSPQVSTSVNGTSRIVTASVSNFSMILRFWPSSMDTPSATVVLPF